MGKHTLKAGVDYIWNPVEGGFFEFNSTLEIDFAMDPSVILGDPATYPARFRHPGLGRWNDLRQRRSILPGGHQAAWASIQDDWKTPRLTLNLGLRWDKDFK